MPKPAVIDGAVIRETLDPPPSSGAVAVRPSRAVTTYTPPPATPLPAPVRRGDSLWPWLGFSLGLMMLSTVIGLVAFFRFGR